MFIVFSLNILLIFLKCLLPWKPFLCFCIFSHHGISSAPVSHSLYDVLILVGHDQTVVYELGTTLTFRTQVQVWKTRSRKEVTTWCMCIRLWYNLLVFSVFTYCGIRILGSYFVEDFFPIWSRKMCPYLQQNNIHVMRTVGNTLPLLINFFL